MKEVAIEGALGDVTRHHLLQIQHGTVVYSVSCSCLCKVIPNDYDVLEECTPRTHSLH